MESLADKKRCRECGELKPVTEFGRDTGSPDLLRRRCKPCQNALFRKNRAANLERYKTYEKKWRDANPKKSREYKRRSYEKNDGALKAKLWRYGQLNWTRWSSLEEMKEAQGDRCAICRRLPHEVPGHRGHDLALDHCHETNEVRGLLCKPCNTSLGWLQDDPRIALAAAIYLFNKGASRDAEEQNSQLVRGLLSLLREQHGHVSDVAYSRVAGQDNGAVKDGRKVHVSHP